MILKYIISLLVVTILLVEVNFVWEEDEGIPK